VPPFDRRKVNGWPFTLVCRRVGIKCLDDARQAEHGFFFAAALKENKVARLHDPKVFCF
jgi:hypothetical protein